MARVSSSMEILRLGSHDQLASTGRELELLGLVFRKARVRIWLLRRVWVCLRSLKMRMMAASITVTMIKLPIAATTASAP